MLALNDNFSAGDRLIIGQKPDFLSFSRIQLNHRATAHFQKLVDRHGGLAEDDGYLNINLVDGIHVSGPLSRITPFSGYLDPQPLKTGLPGRKRKNGIEASMSFSEQTAARGPVTHLYAGDSTVEWRISDGLVAYPDAVAEMEARAAAIAAGDAPELVWLLEHPPLYTAGTSTDPKDLLTPDRFPVYETGRGGQYTYHGPGQRVAYAMLNLKKRGQDVRAYVAGLEDWIIGTLAHFHVKGEIRDDRVGVWVQRPERGLNTEDKIAAIGVRVRRWVTFHGISINVDPNLEHFSGIVPCGIQQHGVTSFEDLGLTASMPDIDMALREEFERVFGPIIAEGTSAS